MRTLRETGMGTPHNPVFFLPFQPAHGGYEKSHPKVAVSSNNEGLTVVPNRSCRHL